MTKHYMLDTNVIIYRADLSSASEEQYDKYDEHYKGLINNADSFYKDVFEHEIKGGNATWCLSPETVRELKIQSYLKRQYQPELQQKIDLLIKEILVVNDFHLNQSLEQDIREMSSYISHVLKPKAFPNGFILNSHKIIMDYGAVSDVRILWHAFCHSQEHFCPIVTNNVKDFSLYPFLFEPSEKVLFDIKTYQYIVHDTNLNLYSMVQSDKRFLNLQANMLEERYNLLNT